MGKIFRISLKLNFTPNTLGCYGLKKRFHKSIFFLATLLVLHVKFFNLTFHRCEPFTLHDKQPQQIRFGKHGLGEVSFVSLHCH